MPDLPHVGDEPFLLPEWLMPSDFAGTPSEPRLNVWLSSVSVDLNSDHFAVWRDELQRSALLERHSRVQTASMATGLSGGSTTTVTSIADAGEIGRPIPLVSGPIPGVGRHERISALLLRDETLRLLEELTQRASPEDIHGALLQFLLASDRTLHTFAALVLDDVIGVQEHRLRLTDFGRRFIAGLASRAI